MSLKNRGEMIRQQILRDVKHHPKDIAQHIGQIFSISRQAVNRHIKKLVEDGWLSAEGSTRSRVYQLGSKRKNLYTLDLNGTLSEDEVYNQEFAWVTEGVPKNIDYIIFYGFTEMVNNAIDHSQGDNCSILVEKDSKSIKIVIFDDGEGIFKRITRLKELTDEKQALLELYKGKLTTDSENHSGQGIFFTSRMFDTFNIYSGDLIFTHDHNEKLDMLWDDNDHDPEQGTFILMEISLTSTRTADEVFNEFSSDEDYSFNTTIIPVDMARFDKENLVSRSQAKRLLARVENFKFVYLDFQNVDSIGQAFADEIFRVYVNRHPEISIHYSNESEDVLAMIKRAQNS